MMRDLEKGESKIANLTPQLNRLQNERVLEVVKTQAGFVLYEACDGFFGVAMTPDELVALAKELEQLAK